MAESVLMKDAYHVRAGLTRMYAVDAQNAVSQHPDEWSFEPWSYEDGTAARQRLAEQHAIEVENAKVNGLPVPPPIPPEPAPPTPEEQAAIIEHAQAVAEANERLKVFRAKQAEEQKIAEQVAADEALVKSPPPAPDPTVRRPLSPTQIRKRAAETDEERATREKSEKAAQVERDRIASDKANVDKIAGAPTPNFVPGPLK